MKVVLMFCAAAVVLAACSDDKVVPPGNDAQEVQTLQRDCDNPKWKEQNLGLWYSVCRKSLSW